MSRHIQTGSVVQSPKAAPEGSAGEVRRLFSPDHPASLSVVFTVTTDGYLLQAGALDDGTVISVELALAGTYTPLKLRGESQQLTSVNNVLQINTPGRYRLRVLGAQDAGSAVVEGSSLRDWT